MVELSVYQGHRHANKLDQFRVTGFIVIPTLPVRIDQRDGREIPHGFGDIGCQRRFARQARVPQAGEITPTPMAYAKHSDRQGFVIVRQHKLQQRFAGIKLLEGLLLQCCQHILYRDELISGQLS